MDFLKERSQVRNVLKIPSPKVFAWSSRREENPVNAEYIIMEKVPGIELEKLWEDITGRQKYEIVKQLVGIEKSFATTRFTSFGSLYYTEDVPKVSNNEILYVNKDRTEIQCSRFAIGPTNNRMFFDEGRGTVHMDRGPWSTAEDYVIAIARREIECIMTLQEFPRPQGLFYGPGQYRPTATSKLLALTNYLKVSKHLLPKEESFQASIIWHSDLHTNNIFVNPEKPTEIVGIIDWQSVHLSPLFLQARHPALLEFNGPIPEGLSRIELPENFDEMSADEQKQAKILRSAQSLYKLYEVELRQRNEDISRALQYRETLACKITALAGSLFSDGEPIVNGMLMAVEREWLNIVGTGPDGRPSIPCPLVFSAEERNLQSMHEAQWIRGVELMEAVLEQLGVYRGWDGWVNHASYESMKARLESCREHFLDRETKNDMQRTEWIKAWPFAEQLSQAKMRHYTPPLRALHP
ncbi:MAG: hypothetical protein Q9163_002826 [Psora crenata]